MLLEYLNKRYEILNSRLKKNQEKRDHNLIAIVETNNKIDELDSSVDEASEIFSVKMRENGNFKTQEINELELRITAYITENETLDKIINEINEELQIVTDCIQRVKKNNVSRETLLSERDVCDKTYKETNNELMERIMFCRDICTLDSNRVKLELDNIVKTFIEKDNNDTNKK